MFLVSFFIPCFLDYCLNFEMHLSYALPRSFWLVAVAAADAAAVTEAEEDSVIGAARSEPQTNSRWSNNCYCCW